MLTSGQEIVINQENAMLELLPSSLCSSKTLLLTAVFLSLTGGVVSGGEQSSTNAFAKVGISEGIFSALKGFLDAGDRAYNVGKMPEALEEYKKARDYASQQMCPTKLKVALDDRYALALSQVAMGKAREGSLDTAQKLMEEALKLSPEQVAIRREAAKLKDTTRFNPASTEKHVEDVAEVNKLLQMGFGFYDLGDFDKATEKFQSVLRLDPYNAAARRGMETVVGAKSDYNKAAYDEARATVLDQVDEAWKMPLPPEALDVSKLEGMQGAVGSLEQNSLQKLTTQNVGKVDLENVDIAEAVDFVRSQAVRLDAQSPSGQKGVNIVVDFGQGAKAQELKTRRFNVRLDNVPLSEVLRYIAQSGGMQVVETPFALKLVQNAAAADAADLMMRTFNVGPTFFVGESGEESSTPTDPFSTEAGAETSRLKVKRVDPRSILERAGVTFPDGASVSYNSVSAKLIVRNTPSNISLIEEVINAKLAAVPAQAIIKVRFIEVNVKKAKELGFDWIIGLSAINNKPGRWLGGGQNISDYQREQMPPPGEFGYPDGLVTGGLRSGNQVDQGDQLDRLLETGNSRMLSQSINQKAPAILSARAVSTNADITFIMRGLDQSKAADIMEQPQVMAKSGETASFSNIKEFIYPSEYSEPQLAQNSNNNNNNNNNNNYWGVRSQVDAVTPAHPTAFETTKVGVSLEVTPSFSPGQPWVELQLNPILREFEGFVNYGSPIMKPTTDSKSETGLSVIMLQENRIVQPVFLTKTASTSVTVASGHTLIIGGLLKSKKVKFEDKVPVIGDVPLVGRLFRSEGVTTEEKALIITVSAEIVDPSGKSVNPVVSEALTEG